MRWGRPSGQDGFTLIELLVVIAILGVLTVPLSNLGLEGFRYFATTKTRLDDSHDVQIATAYFSQDVANSGSRSYVTDPVNGTSQQSIWVAPTFPASYCGHAPGMTPVVLLIWDTITASTSGGSTPTTTVSRRTDSVAYVAESDGSLHRIYCVGTARTDNLASVPGTTASSDATVVHDYRASDPSNLTPVTCSSTCTSTTLPVSVSFKLSIQGPTDRSPVYITLTGERRQT